MSAAAFKTSDIKSIKTNSFYLIVGQILSRMMQVVYGAALIRHYGASEYGIFQSAIHWYVALVPLTLLGFGPTLALRIGSNQPGSASLIQKTLAVRTLFASLLCGIALWAAFVFPIHEDKRAFLLLFAPLLVLRALLNWTREVYTAHESSQFHFRQIGISNFAQLAVGLCVMHLSGSLFYIGFSMIAITALELLTSIIFIYKKYKPNALSLSSVNFWEYVKQSLPIGVSQLAIRWMLLGPIAISQWLMRPSEKFGAASFVVLNLFFVCLLFDSVSRSWLAVAGRQSDQKSYAAIQSKILYRLIGIAVVVSIFCYSVGQWMMGKVFATQDPVILVMLGVGMGAVVPYAISTTLMQYLIVRSKYKQLLIASVVGFCTMLLGVYMASSQASEMWVVVSSLIGISALSAIILYNARGVMGFKLKVLLLILIGAAFGSAFIQSGINL